MTKYYLSLLLLCWSFSAFSQKLPDDKQLQQLWAELVIPVIELDSAKLREHIHYPVGDYWGYMARLTIQEHEWTEDIFFENLPKIFAQDIRDSLAKLDYRALQPFINDNRLPNAVVSLEHLISYSSTEPYEYGFILRLQPVNGRWMIVEVIGYVSGIGYPAPYPPAISAEERKQIWNTCVKPILARNQTQLKKITNWPLLGNWGYAVNKNPETEEMTPSDFFDNLSLVFRDESLAPIKKMSWKDLQINQQDDGTYMVSLFVDYYTPEGDPTGFTIFSFHKVNSQWKFKAMTFVGE